MMLTRKDVAEQSGLMRRSAGGRRRDRRPAEASRADIVLGSACIILGAMRALGVECFTLSINSLRSASSRDVQRPRSDGE